MFSRFAALPALTKRELRVHGPQGFVPDGRDIDEGLAAREIELVETSGATGDRVTNVWYQPWWDASEAASWRLNAHARAAATGSHREAILTSPWCTGFPCEEGYLTMEQRTLGRFLFLSERSDPSSWSSDLMDRMVEELNIFEPVILEANPSFLARLSRHIVRRRLRVAFASPHCPDVRESLGPAPAPDPPGLRYAHRQFIWRNRSRLRVHGVRSRASAPGDHYLPRGLSAFCP